jgi:transposase-like protein
MAKRYRSVSNSAFDPRVDFAAVYPRRIRSIARRADLLAERGLGILCKTVRRWMLKFGPLIARGPFGSSARTQPAGYVIGSSMEGCAKF